MNTEVMEKKVMEKKLYDACLKGDVETLKALMREDELTLARISIFSYLNQTPLHLASMLGHFEFAKSLLSYERGFASRLDSQGRSPLHLASANGHANIVKLLLEYDEKMCKVPDEDERTPLHLAVMNGQSDSVTELIKINSVSDDKELGTILHLCVVHNRLNVLILVLESNEVDLSNIKNEEGNTILHSAAALRRMQIVKYLVKNSSQEEVNVRNKRGLTALGMIEEMPKDAKTMEIKELLISAGTLRANKNIAAPARSDSIFNKPLTMLKKVRSFTIFQDKMEKRDETLLVAASVIAAMAYTSAVSPPGGVAGIDATTTSFDDPWFKGYYLAPGSSLLAYFYAPLSNTFWRANTISFMAALSVIFIYVTGASLKHKVFIWAIRAAMWVTLSAMIIAYEAAVRATTPKYNQNGKTLYTIRVGLYSWMVLMVIAIVVVVYRAARYVTRRIIKRRASRNKINSSVDASTVTSPSHNNIV